MKNSLLALLGINLLITQLAATAQQFGDFTYSSDGSAITIIGYTGAGGDLTIPDTINGLPVTAIGDAAFAQDGSGDFIITGVTIPNSVTSIGSFAFAQCTSLTGIAIPHSITNVGMRAFVYCINLNTITVDAGSPSYSSLDGVLFNKSQTALIEFPGGKAGNYSIPSTVTSIGDYACVFCFGLTSITIPGGVTNIGADAFAQCTNLANATMLSGVTAIGSEAFFDCPRLTNLSIPDSVTTIGEGAFDTCASLGRITIPGSVSNVALGTFAYCYSLTNVTIPAAIGSVGQDAFYDCTNLQGLFFKGNAPALIGADVFVYDTNAIVYYLPGATGWGTTFAGRPAVLWNPLMQSSSVGPSGFGFNITGTADIPIVVEAATSPANATWVPLQTLNLTNGAFNFIDPNWTNYPTRFYRIRSP
jgi:hypothetical protein